MGVAINAAPGGTAPLRVAARPSGQALRALDETLPVASAQVKTCLLLAALAADGDSTLREPGPSRDHTERMLGSMGVQVQHTGPGEGAGTYTTRLTPPGPSRLKPLRIRLPGDISSAAFLIVAGLITPGSEVRIRGVGLNPTRTGLLDALKAMGADLTLENLSEAGGEPSGDVVVTASRLTATQVHGPLVVRMIDEFTVFGTAAAYAAGCTTVREARELRFKESDRVASLCAELTALGVRCEEHPDGFNVWGGQPVGGQAQSHGDHRLAMAMTVAGLAAGAPVTVNGAEMIAESFPGFTAVLRSLGARIEDNGGETAGGRLPSTAAQGTP
jgi:3-phosphoshikimate 1-carboxyvinyltransferase